jgi:hypothetical protein
MAEHVKADPSESYLKTGWDEVIGADRVGVIRTTRDRTWEEPTDFGIDAENLPFLQFEDEAAFERDFVLRILRL